MAIIKPNNNTMSAVTAAGLPTLAGSNMPSGTVLQVVSARPAVTLDTNSTSYQATGTELDITPTATSSKIWVVVTSGLFWANSSTAGGVGGVCTIYRDSTNLGQGGTNQMVRTYRVEGVSIQTVASMSILDSPNTTSSIKYEVYMKSVWNTPTMKWNDSGADIATITAYEIKG